MFFGSHLLVGVVLLGISVAGWAEPSHFGSKLTLTEKVSVSGALSNFDQLKEKEILLTGEVRKVCQKKGCWMMITDNKEAVRVHFADYGFFMPKDLGSKTVLAQGKLVKKTLNEKTLKHYLHDEDRPKAEIDQVKGSKEVIQFIAQGVQVVGS